ncbi:hypothetical protein OS493_022346 [Desmophyllum pertusum]|uniref:Uncharacterized protein n=1 Tax=Desmophyllum pertusum TaxID=174260 RepID=A0A9X0A0W4_9CNID|nr:hypothetical protein OS493_022346 [Desmophyllum pertusum]
MMSEGSRVDNGRRMEAACNKLIDIELNALNGREISSQDNAEQPSSITQTTPRFAELSSSKDSSREEQYIDQAKLNRASLYSRITNKEETTQSTTLELDEREEDREENNLTENKELLAKTPPETEKEEGNYEELICLVRQFYVERPINPAAIAYQNIETC